MIVLIFIISTLAEQIAAYVGDDVILESELRENMRFLANDPVAQQMFTSTDELRDYVLNEIISQKLILVEAENESISVTKEEIEPRITQMIEDIKEKYPSEADFLKALQEQGLTLKDLKANYEENLKTKLIMQKLIENKFSGIMISPIAVKRFYEENKDSIANRPARVKLSHILMFIKPSEAESRKGFDEALDVYKLLYTGGDFSILAQEFSEDENSKYKGGMLGKIKKGETMEEFEGMVFKLKPGTISQPFPTRLGYHIVEVLNKGADWVLLRQILIKVKVTKADTLSTENFSNKLGELIGQGADFDSLAQIYSDDPNIDLGEFYINQLSPPVDEIVKNLEPGQLSEPLLTPYGFHQIYLREKISEEPLTFEELRDQIYQYLYQQDLQKYFTQLIEELKEKTFIKIFPPSQL
ncbi:peptidylprolyl isomerase [candidate division WOR-3 bacterium]|nr:peptidylprolyl isomerase [candidate division WOR-3 bacterium]